MKLLILFHSLDNLAGGVDNRLSTLEYHFPDNINREFLLFKNTINLPHKGKINIINSLKIPKYILTHKKKLKLIAFIFGFVNLFYRIYHTRKFIKNNNFTTILAVDDYFSLIAIISTLGMNIKIISSVRNSWDKLYNNTMVHLLPDYIYLKILPKLFNKYVSHVHCVSECLSKQLKKNYTVNNTICIYNLFDTEYINKLSLEAVAFNFSYIVNIGHLNHQKNQRDLIYAFSILRKKGFKEKLVLIGDGEERTPLLKLTKKLQLEDDVIFTGKQENPFKYLKHASLYVSSSLYEGLPAVLVESLILNIPIVSYDFECGAKELTNNTTQLNYNALAIKMQELLTNEKLKENSIMAGKNLLKEKFTKQQIINQWLELLN